MPASELANGRPGIARVAIVGAGVISPLGAGLHETSESLRVGRDCVSSVERFPVEQCRCKTAGQVRDEQLEAYASGRRGRRLHRVARMTIAALVELMQQAPGFQPELTVVGTTSGGMTFGEE